jgi:hypothetical protein
LSFYAQWFDLSSAYGVLLREDFVTLANIAKKRSTVAESYASVLTDLDYAIANAPAINKNIYVTRYAAMALKMRVLMSHAETADYTTVISLADSIILNSSYTLENNTKDIFYTKALTSKEVILGIQPEQNQEAYYYNLSHQYYPGASGLYVAKDELKTLLQDDPRSSWIIGPVNAYGGYYFLKYIAADNNPSIVSETAYAFRLSETYLLKAEAIVRSGGSLADARVILKTIMGHAGVTDFSSIDNATTQDEMLMQIYLEIVRNLVGEDGQEWMALLRFPLATVQQLRPTITDKIRYILPIPHIEFVSNPAIGDQNPGYQK